MSLVGGWIGRDDFVGALVGLEGVMVKLVAVRAVRSHGSCETG